MEWCKSLIVILLWWQPQSASTNIHKQRLHWAIVQCCQQPLLPLAQADGSTVKVVMFDFCVTCMFTQASLPRAGDPQHQHRLLLRCVPSQGAKLLHYRINFLRQGAADEAHSAAALHTFLRQSLRILENKIRMDIHNYFPTWLCSPLIWVWIRSFEIPNGFARESKLRNTVREGLSKQWWDICFELWWVHCAVPSTHLTCSVHSHLENRNVNILLNLLQFKQALPSVTLMLCGLLVYLNASEGTNHCWMLVRYSNWIRTTDLLCLNYFAAKRSCGNKLAWASTDHDPYYIN